MFEVYLKKFVFQLLVSMQYLYGFTMPHFQDVAFLYVGTDWKIWHLHDCTFSDFISIFCSLDDIGHFEGKFACFHITIWLFCYILSFFLNAYVFILSIITLKAFTIVFFSCRNSISVTLQSRKCSLVTSYDFQQYVTGLYKFREELCTSNSLFKFWNSLSDMTEAILSVL